MLGISGENAGQPSPLNSHHHLTGQKGRGRGAGGIAAKPGGPAGEQDPHQDNEDGEGEGPGPSSALAPCPEVWALWAAWSARYSECQGSKRSPPVVCHSALRSFKKMNLVANTKYEKTAQVRLDFQFF